MNYAVQFCVEVGKNDCIYAVVNYGHIYAVPFWVEDGKFGCIYAVEFEIWLCSGDFSKVK